MSSVLRACQRLEQAVDVLVQAVDSRQKADGKSVEDSPLHDDVAELRTECAKLTDALKLEQNRNRELDRVVDEIHRRLGSTIAEIDDLMGT